MEPHVFSGSDPIAVWSFSAIFKKAYSHNCVLESIAVQGFQFHVKDWADMLFHTRLTESLMAWYSERPEMLRTYGNLVKVLLLTCAMDEVIMELYNKVSRLRQSTAMTEKTYFETLWDKFLQCKAVCSDRWLKFFFIDRLYYETWARARQLLLLYPRLDYHTVFGKPRPLATTIESQNDLQ